MRAAGISPGDLDTPETWLPARLVANLLQESASASKRPDFAILMAECRTFSNLGPLSLLLKHESSLRRIIQRIDEFKRHLNDIFGIHLDVTGDVATVQWTVPPDYANPQVVTLVAAVGYRGLSDAVSGIWVPEVAHFPFTEPTGAGSYRRYFPCAIQFDSHFSGLSFPAADLDLSNPSADPALAGHAATLLKLVPTPSESIVDRATHVLLLLLPLGKATLGAVARNLGTEPRTLQRMLDAHGMTFATLLNETRRSLAARHLASRARTVSEVASLTGYSSISAFTRWFTDQFGRSPATWRRLPQA